MLHDTTLKQGNPSLRACHLRCSQFDLGEVGFGEHVVKLSSFTAVYCLLSTVYCLLSTVYCLLSPVSCLLSTVYCLLSSVYHLISLFSFLSVTNCLKSVSERVSQ